MQLIEFRQELEKATQGFPGKHPGNIKSLFSKYPHSISLQSNPNIIDTTSDCFTYAFSNLIPQKIFDKIKRFVTDDSNVDIEDYFQKLLTSDFCSVHERKKDGDKIIIYFDNDKVKHFGRIKEDKIISKWGEGLIWKHAVFEVPLSYGNIVKYSDGNINLNILKEIFQIHS